MEDESEEMSAAKAMEMGGPLSIVQQRYAFFNFTNRAFNDWSHGFTNKAFNNLSGSVWSTHLSLRLFHPSTPCSLRSHCTVPCSFILPVLTFSFYPASLYPHQSSVTAGRETSLPELVCMCAAVARPC